MALQLIGVKEACDLLSCSAEQFWTLRQKEDFPAAVANLASGSVWKKTDIQRYNRKYRRAREAVTA